MWKFALRWVCIHVCEFNKKEGFPRQFTFIGFFSSESSFMALKGPVISKGFTVQLALIVFQFSMNSFMSSWGSPQNEGFPTFLTGIVFLSTRYSLKASQGSVDCEGGAILLICVSTFMYKRWTVRSTRQILHYHMPFNICKSLKDFPMLLKQASFLTRLLFFHLFENMPTEGSPHSWEFWHFPDTYVLCGQSDIRWLHAGVNKRWGHPHRHVLHIVLLRKGFSCSQQNLEHGWSFLHTDYLL